MMDRKRRAAVFSPKESHPIDKFRWFVEREGMWERVPQMPRLWEMLEGL